ncbi:hypothetical protein Pcinc_013174 [Petrolisthes cinctipes]|uniref:Regulatory protein zeste n=1 Tax=Petrolisthes cinctipes TaxID=88211 RepID=A0AAE1G0B6_PETCI|nr:hypothetical protein Pcinc_013174 [Petrolisthes cinctipes]
MDRAAPLSQPQTMALLNLIKERVSIVHNKSTAPGILEAKKRTWEEIVLKFNALNPDHQPRSSKQLKRSYEHVKRKEYKKKIKVTGGGCHPTPPKATEEIALAASMMTVDLAMGNDVFETFNQEPVHDSSAADVYELQEEVVDDPGVPGPHRKRLEIEVMMDDIHKLEKAGKVRTSLDLQPSLLTEAGKSQQEHRKETHSGSQTVKRKLQHHLL